MRLNVFMTDFMWVCLPVNLLNLVTFLLCGAYVLYRIHFKLDFAAIITLSLYTICISMRTALWIFFAIFINNYSPILFLVNSIAERLKWFILYHFILEM